MAAPREPIDRDSGLLRLLLRLYPEGFREQHGRDLAELYRDQYGGEGGLKFWARVCADALWNGLLARLGSVAGDLRHGARTLLATPGHTAVLLVTLAFGIGANTAIFSLVNGVLLRPLPYVGGDRVIQLLQPARLAGIDNLGFSPPEVADYRQQASSLAGVVEYHSMSFTLLGQAEPQRVQTGVVSAGFFDAMGVRPLLGRGFREEDDQAGAPPVLVVSHEFWQRALGSDPRIVGRTFTMNDRVHTVVGVLPSIPQYPNENDVYMPVAACPFRRRTSWADNRDARGLAVFARLAPGATLETARAELATIASRLHAAHPNSYKILDGLETSAIGLQEELTKKARPTLYVLLGTAAFLLLIVCANVANLTLARFSRREREMALRSALGATRGRLLRQLVTENAVLALAGGALGVLAAHLSLGALSAYAARFTPRAREIDIDGRVLLFALLLSLGTGLFLGALPAIPSRLELLTDLKEAAASATRGGRRLRAFLIVSQVAISFTLLIGAGLMLRSFLKLASTDPGFDPQHVLTARVDLNWSRYDKLEKVQAFAQGLSERLRGQAGTVAVATAGDLPLNGGSQWGGQIRAEGRASEGANVLADYKAASPDYFQLLGAPLLQGRAFTAADTASPAAVVVLSQALARRVFGGEGALGKRVSTDGEHWATVVGVVSDVKERELASAGRGVLYLPFASLPWRDVRVLVRSQSEPAAVERQIRAAVRELDPDQPVTDVLTLEKRRSDSIAAPRLTAALLGLFALLAVGITAAGIAGVIAVSVSQRTRELGIRLALGAPPASVLAMVLREGMLLVAAGLALGLGGALVLTRLLSGLLFGIEASDPLTFAAVSLAVLLVGAAACLLPSWKVISLDPADALRSV